MRAIIDDDVCTGCGLCIDICPEVFAMSTNFAEVIVDPVPESVEDQCIEAVDSCPVEAISINQ